jgi:hypothetical protein
MLVKKDSYIMMEFFSRPKQEEAETNAIRK